MNDINWQSLIGVLFFLLLMIMLFTCSMRPSKAIKIRQRLIEQMEMRRGSRVIVMIDQPKPASFLGMPLSRSLDIDDPTDVLRRIRHTLPSESIDLIVHTTGGAAMLSEPIANALMRHNRPVTLMVPYSAMSGGTRLALAADKILMSRNAVLGPEACPPGSQPPLGILEALVKVLSDGCWTHTAPITFDMARELGMAVSDELPNEAYQIVDLYPQAAHPLPLVNYAPLLPSPDHANLPKPEEEKA